MVLYALYHGGSLIQCIVHRLTKHRNEDAILLVGNTRWHIGNKYNVKQMQSIFTRVIPYEANFAEGLRGSVEKIEQAILEKYDQVFAKEKINFGAFSEIYNSIDIPDSLGIYFSLKCIKYNRLELGRGSMKKFEKHPEWVYSANFNVPDYAKVCDNHKVLLAYSNPLITPIAFEDFNWPSEFKTLSKMDIENIIIGYGLKNCTENITSFFMPSSDAVASKRLHSDDFYKKYFNGRDNAYFTTNALFLDLLVDDCNNLTIKPHPSMTTILKDTKDLNTFPGYVPAELLPFMTNIDLKFICGFGSDSVLNIANMFPECKCMGVSNDMYAYANVVLKAYTAKELSCFLGTKCQSIYGLTSAFYSIFSNESQQKNNEVSVLTKLTKTNEFTILDNVDESEENFNIAANSYIKNANELDVIVVLNTKQNDGFLDWAVLGYMTLIELSKIQINPKAVGNFEKEFIYVFCKNEDKRSHIESFVFSRELQYTGIKLEVKSAADELVRIKTNIECKKYDVFVDVECDYGIQYSSDERIKCISCLAEYYTSTKALLKVSKEDRDYLKIITALKNTMDIYSTNKIVYTKKVHLVRKTCKNESEQFYFGERYIEVFAKFLIRYDVANIVRNKFFSDAQLTRYGIFDHEVFMHPSYFMATSWYQAQNNNQFVLCNEICWTQKYDNDYDRIVPFVKNLKSAARIYAITSYLEEILAHDPEMIDDIAIMKITKSPDNDMLQYGLEDEYLYFYSRNKDDLSQINRLKIAKKLMSLGIEISVCAILGSALIELKNNLKIQAYKNRNCRLETEIKTLQLEQKKAEINKCLKLQANKREKELKDQLNLDASFDVKYSGYHKNTFSILGCCVSRDIFRICDKENKYVINNYVSLSNPIKSFLYPERVRINVENVDFEDKNISLFRRKCFVRDVNSSGISYLLSTKSEYLVIDLADMRLPMVLMRNEMESYLITRTNVYNKYKEKNGGQLLKDFVEEDIKADMICEDIIQKTIKYIADSVKRIYPAKKVILIESYPINQIANEANGCLEHLQYQSMSAFDLIKPATEAFRQYVGDDIVVVETLTNNIGSPIHTWGIYPLHFKDEWYQYVFDCIEQYVKNKDKDFSKIKGKHEKSMQEYVSKFIK
ncbi:MAG: DUF6270 domain-containing protein [Bacillota bacterium]